METTATGPLRWLRAGVLAAISVLTGSLAHVSAEGLLPGPTTLVLLTLLLASFCTPLLRRAASRLRVVLLLVAGQTFIHVALSATAGHVGDPVSRPAPVPVLPEVGAHTPLADQLPQVASAELTVPVWVTHLVTELTGPAAWMAMAHLAAAVLVGLWLASGERALFTVLGLARAVVRLLLVWVAPIRTLPTVSASYAAVPVVLRHQRFACTTRRRGPPLTV